MLVTNIQQFAVRDGPGIRTTVFTKGCSLHCKWCHNPEAIGAKNEVQYSALHCVHCGLCATVCDRFKKHGGIKLSARACKSCGKCINVCPTKALAFCAKEMTAKEVAREALKDNVIFRNSGGGVTFSGGEPLLQQDLPEALALVKQSGTHTAVDTALNVPWRRIEAVLPHTSLFLADIKAITPEEHKKWTGCDNRLILENFMRLIQTDVPIWVRVPFIPDANENEMPLIADFLYKTCKGRVSVEVVPFHNYAVSKYRSLGMKYDFAEKLPPDEKTLARVLKLFSKLDLINYKK